MRLDMSGNRVAMYGGQAHIVHGHCQGIGSLSDSRPTHDIISDVL